MASVPAAEGAQRASAARGGMLRTSDALRLGIYPRTLYALRGAGEIEAVGRGLYRLDTAPPLTSPDFVAIAILVPGAVICLVSGLSHHGLTTQIPHAVDVALPSHARVPQSCHVPLRTYWFSEPAYSTGVEKILLDGVPVPIYSAEKSIADCFKYRNKVGLDVAIEALRTYREITKRPNYKALTEHAAINRVQSVRRPHLDVIYERSVTSTILSAAPFESRPTNRTAQSSPLLLAAWKAPRSRPTMGIDLAGRTNNSLEHIAQVTASVCEQSCEADGIQFLANTVATTRIKDDPADQLSHTTRPARTRHPCVRQGNSYR